MFDFSFWEMVVVAVVTLIVVGPEKLPGLARTAGLWLGRARRMVASVRDDIEREIKAEELKRIMEQQAQSTGLHEIIEEGRYTLDGLTEELDDTEAPARKPEPAAVPKANAADAAKVFAAPGPAGEAQKPGLAPAAPQIPEPAPAAAAKPESTS